MRSPPDPSASAPGDRTRDGAEIPLLWQPGLFDRVPPRSPAAPAPPNRRSLDATSWVELHPGWLPEPEPLFRALLESTDWQQRDRWIFDRSVTEPRLTAEVRRLRESPHPDLADLAARLSASYGVRFDGVWMNLYRDGQDSTAWHRDRFACRREECIVPVLTLGTTRRFLLRRRSGGPSIALAPQAGTLLVMGGRCQQDWMHAVPKQSGIAGARISVNFQSSDQAGG